jgi:hypothetical protein
MAVMKGLGYQQLLLGHQTGSSYLDLALLLIKTVWSSATAACAAATSC